MPSLRDYRDRITSVKSTKKITSAMKMVAASKLKKAQDQAESSQPYAKAMAEMMARVAANIQLGPNSSKLLIGTGSDKTHLIVAVSSDRGLCGGFNAYVAKKTLSLIEQLESEGKTVKLLCIGRKVRDSLSREHKDKIIRSFTGLGGRTKINFSEAQDIAQYLFDEYAKGTYDVCSLAYNEFVSVLTQRPQATQLIPFKLPKISNDNADQAAGPQALYSFEPNEEEILNELLPRNISIQVYRALLDSAAGEQAARMTAMDAATRNAGDKISDLTLQYNRARQAYITKELIEIISGAEAL